MLKEIIRHYFPDCRIMQILPFGNGHINTTYKVDLRGTGKSYILQRINTGVFKDPWGIARTHQQLQRIILSKEHPIMIAALIPTSDGQLLYEDSDQGVWRMTSFIDDSFTLEVVTEPWQATQAGIAYGWFAQTCSDLDPETFTEAIVNFHRLSFRIIQLNDAIKNDVAGRLDGVKDIVSFFKSREASLSHIEQLVDQGSIPVRVVHNDPKINNLMFKGNKAVAVIDLDTVGPGILFYDYGDALRTSASTAEEDEKELGKMTFNIEYFTAFTRGYLPQVKDILSPDEMEHFHQAPLLMTYIIGIRFLADYLNGDLYFKTAYADHNLVRCKTQKKLIESIEQQQEKIMQVIDSVTGDG